MSPTDSQIAIETSGASAEQDPAKALVIYHKRCPSGDGFASAFAAWLALRDRAQYLPADYGDAIPCVAGRDVFIVDLSFEEAVMERLGREAKSLTLLDHHLTAQKRLGAFKPACCGKIHFDLTKCGAALSWEHFHPGKPIPRLIRWIQSRDLWDWEEPGTKEFLAWLDTQPKRFELWETLLALTDAELDERVRLGAALSQQRDAFCRSIAAEALPVVIAGEAGLMVNGSPEFRSEVGSLMAERCGSFGLVWRVVDGGRVACSLRSNEPYDVERLATQFGGGGHKTAASFTLTLDRLMELASGALRAPEGP